MDYPYGEMIGNACEVWEALEAMRPGSAYMDSVKDIVVDFSRPELIKVEHPTNSLKELLVYIVFEFAFQVKWMTITENKNEETAKQIV